MNTKQPNTVPLHDWFEKISESAAAYAMKHVKHQVGDVMKEPTDFEYVGGEELGMFRFYKSLVYAYNEAIGGDITFEDFMFESETTQHVIGELGSHEIQTRYNNFALAYQLLGQNIVQKISENIEQIGKKETLLSFSLDSLERFGYYLAGSNGSRQDILQILYYLEHNINSWKQRLELLDILHRHVVELQGEFLGKTVWKAIEGAIGQAFDDVRSTGLDKCIEAFGQVEIIDKILPCAGQLASECWEQSFKNVVKRLPKRVDKFILLEELYQYLENLQITMPEQQEDEKDKNTKRELTQEEKDIQDHNNHIEYHKGFVFDYARALVEVHLPQSIKIKKATRQYLKMLIDIHKNILASGKPVNNFTNILEAFLGRYLRENKFEYVPIREMLEYDKKGLQLFVDRAMNIIIKKDVQ